jgi:hypothetical protein
VEFIEDWKEGSARASAMIQVREFLDRHTP